MNLFGGDWCEDIKLFETRRRLCCMLRFWCAQFPRLSDGGSRSVLSVVPDRSQPAPLFLSFVISTSCGEDPLRERQLRFHRVETREALFFYFFAFTLVPFSRLLFGMYFGVLDGFVVFTRSCATVSLSPSGEI